MKGHASPFFLRSCSGRSPSAGAQVLGAGAEAPSGLAQVLAGELRAGRTRPCSSRREGHPPASLLACPSRPEPWLQGPSPGSLQPSDRPHSAC